MGLLHAIVFGADGACIDLGVSSILPVVAIFMTVVVILQLVASRALRALFGRQSSGGRIKRKVRNARKHSRDAAKVVPRAEQPADRGSEKRTGNGKYDSGPIISTRRM